MFRILVLDDRESIRLGIKHLLYRYELIFGKETSADLLLNEDRISLILVNLIREDGTYSNWELLKKWSKRKKTIVVADNFTEELAAKVQTLGVLTCIDKLDLQKLPNLVERYLNQAATRVISLDVDPDNQRAG